MERDTEVASATVMLKIHHNLFSFSKFQDFSFSSRKRKCSGVFAAFNSSALLKYIRTFFDFLPFSLLFRSLLMVDKISFKFSRFTLLSGYFSGCRAFHIPIVASENFCIRTIYVKNTRGISICIFCNAGWFTRSPLYWGSLK